MAQRFDLLLKNGTVVTHERRFEADIGIKDQKIAAFGCFDTGQSDKTIDCRHLHILPGIIDSQVHFREPGLTQKEDLETGSRAAVLGGVTSVFEMPNTSPPTVDAALLQDKLTRAQGRMFCDHAFFVGGTAENVDELSMLELLPGCAGIKVFMGSSTGSLLVPDDDTLSRILTAITRRASFHSEDEMRLAARKDLRIDNDPHSHPVWRDVQSALQSTQRLVSLAERLQKQVHILHISSAEEMQFLKTHKTYASVEVTPHHLTLAAPDCYDRLGTFAQMNPPVRDDTHRAALWRGIEDGTVDVLGSDHAPHTRAEKEKPYPLSPSGMTGVQTLLPVMLDHVNKGRLSLEKFVSLTSEGPRRLFNIRSKGGMIEGSDADFSIVDLKRCETLSNDKIASRCGWTPYDGVNVTGWPVATIIRGHIVMQEGEIIGTAQGKPVVFNV